MNAPAFLVRHLSGSHKGKEETFTENELSFGTGSGNTTRFDPTWDRGVSARHARIFRDEKGGVWLEDAGSGSGTFVNGKRVTVKQKLSASTVIELGQNGPRVEVILEAPPASVSSGAPASSSGSGGGAGVAIALVGLGMVMLGAAFWWFMLRGPSGGGDADSRLQAVAEAHQHSVGLVVMASEGESTPNGTAWCIRDGVFATNAHVALPVMKVLKDGGSAFVILNQRPESRLRVTAAIAHPRYFDSPVNPSGESPATGSYDVGLLLVEGESPEPLALAQRPKLEELGSGHRIAFLGFPMEGLRNGGVDPNHPVATMQSGIVTAATDFWLAKSDYFNRRLIQHNLPAVGGASGSPIFDADGEVVAILSSGNMTATLPFEKWAAYVTAIEKAKREALEEAEAKLESGADSSGAASTAANRQKLVEDLKATMEALDRIPLPISEMSRAPSAAQINFGQRIDMIDDLLSAYDKLKATGEI